MQKIGRYLVVLALGTLLVPGNAPAATLYVNVANTSPTAPYTNWSTAATNIQDAIDAASPDDTVLVTNGVYQYGGRVVFGAMTNRVAVTQPITLQSVNGPSVTTILGYQVPGTTNGDAAIRCVYLTDGAVLAGFTLTNGATRIQGDIAQEQSGGAVLCASSNAFVSNCVLSANTAGNSGGGVRSGTLSNCFLVGNSAGQSGGSAFSSTLFGCVLSGNSAGQNGGGTFSSQCFNCQFNSNSAYYGGGSYFSSLSNCTLTANTAGYEGGGSLNGNLAYCTLTGNSAGNSGGGAYSGTFNNCILRGNSAMYGGGAYGGIMTNCSLSANLAGISGGGVALGRLYNCTVTGNTAPSGGGVWGNGVASLNNCIVYFNHGASNVNFDSTIAINYCCTTPRPSSGSSNITADPQLSSLSHLSANSPCRDAGTHSFATGVDLDGEPWLNPPSIGCDEYAIGSVTGALNVSVGAAYTNVAVGFPLDLSACIDGRTSTSFWDFGDGVTLTNQPNPAHAWSAAGDYTVTLTAFNDTHPEGVTGTLIVHVTQPVHYVALGNPSPVAPYSSWDTAATNIQDAVDAATIPGALVLVSNGVYQTGGRLVSGTTTNRLAVTKPLVVSSVNGPQSTFIVGKVFSPIRCVYLTNGACLSGFTITNGGTMSSGLLGHDLSGAGVWAESGSATISNCVLYNNQASHGGGGIFQGTVFNCTLRGNFAPSFGGGAMNATLYNCSVIGNLSWSTGGGTFGCTVSNCLLIRNRAVSSGDGPISGVAGGAASSVLYNCLIISNTTWSSGGGAYQSTLFNCTLAANSPGGSFGGTLNNCIIYYNTNGNFNGGALTNCCTSNLPPSGVGNFTNAPLFVDRAAGDWHLLSNSPCINAGNNAAAAGVGSTDYEGNPRIIGGTVDVGAYEFQTPSSSISYAWLQQFNLPTDGSADFLDPDHDGLNNSQEWRAGTNPTNAASLLKLLSPLLSTNGSNFTLTWTSVTNRTYYIQRASFLTPPAPFSLLQSNIAGLNGTTSWTDTNAPTPAFYRIGVE